MQLPKNSTISSSLSGIYRLLLIFFSLFVLYFAQTIVIPLIIASLLTFLLSPLVIKLEKWLGRIASILIVVLVVFSTIGLLGYIFVRQFVLFASNFRSYYEIIQTKFEALHFSEGGIFDRIAHALSGFKEEIFGDGVDGDSKISPLQVKLLDLSSNFINFIESFFGSFFNFLGVTGIVLLLVVFMLLNKEDIRGRIIKLIGQNRIGSTTNAMNEASERVFRYLFRLFIVNIVFGICVTIGLYCIGIPNAILWGCFAAVMRFIPYIGSSIAAAIPIALSFIVTNSWVGPVATISFFMILEMITANVIEPLYYGVGTGVSSFALILAAIFWTWLWGPIGLLLSTPITVCLVVIGQHVPNLNFLRILFSQEQALTPAEECYHRLLSFDSSESMDVIEAYLQKNSLPSLYESILIPIAAQSEKDFQLELIDVEQKDEVLQSIREIVEFLNLNEIKEQGSLSNPELKTKGNILCLPTQTVRDEIGMTILAQLLTAESYNVYYGASLSVGEIFDLVDKNNPNVVCIGVIAPFILAKIRFLCARIHQRKPQLPIVICVFGAIELDSQMLDKLISAGAFKVVTSLSQVVQTVQDLQSNPINPQ